MIHEKRDGFHRREEVRGKGGEKGGGGEERKKGKIRKKQLIKKMGRTSE